MTYNEMAQAARTADEDARAAMAFILLRIYEADRTGNNGLVTGEAMLCRAFSSEARQALINAGVIR